MTKSKFLILVVVLSISVACITTNKKPALAGTDGEQKRSSIVGSPRACDSALLDIVEKQTFQYFYDGAEPVSGMARSAFMKTIIILRTIR
jgi:hypothetical protein